MRLTTPWKIPPQLQAHMSLKSGRTLHQRNKHQYCIKPQRHTYPKPELQPQQVAQGHQRASAPLHYSPPCPCHTSHTFTPRNLGPPRVFHPPPSAPPQSPPPSLPLLHVKT